MRPISAGSAALAGTASAAAGLGVGEVCAAVVGLSPVGSVASLVIDLSPSWLKEAMIAIAGTADKLVLVVVLVVAVAAVSVAAGLLERTRPPWGSVLLGALGLVSVAAAATRVDATPLAPLPTVLGTAAGIVALRLLLRLAARREAPQRRAAEPQARAAEQEPQGGRSSRRVFLTSAVATTVIGAAAALVARSASTAERGVEAARRAIRLPKAATAAAPVPAAAKLDVPGISPLITPNADFYRVDTAVFLPVLDPTQWRLRITGMVKKPIEISYQELLRLPLQESRITLACVSNPVAGPYISTATWLGYPVRKLLALAGPSADADMVLSKSSDGFTAGTPLSALTDGRDALVAVGMNGQPLPREHGFPARLVVPGLYGYVSATKWVTELEVTRFDRVQAYWTQRGWGAKGPVKLSSRIDVPRDGAKRPAGLVTVAGVAWEQHTGVSRVEVSVDDGPWHEAVLAEELSIDTWRQWAWQWQAEPGTHRLKVRATDAEGRVQDATERDVLPDGATGLHMITVDV